MMAAAWMILGAVCGAAGIAAILHLRTRPSATQLQRTAYELTENIPVGTYTMVLPPGQAMARFSFLSTRFLELTGLDREATLANPLNAFACVHPDDYDEWLRQNQEVFSKKLPFFGETRILVAGEVRWISAESTPRDLPDGSTVWEGVLIDITDRKLAEQELVAHQAHLRATLEAKLKASLAASAIAHEINQPLSTILLQSKLALRQGDAAAALATVAREADRVVKTIDKMKVLLRSVQTEHEPVELAEAATRSAIFMQGMLDKHVVALRFTGADLGACILGDAVQIQFAINNLLRNAIEAIEANASRREVLLALRADHAFVELTVGDTGSGWSGAERTDLPLTTTKDEGSGIGLYVIRMVVKNHGGTIDFGRSPLGGAEVRLRFPRHHGE